MLKEIKYAFESDFAIEVRLKMPKQTCHSFQSPCLQICNWSVTSTKVVLFHKVLIVVYFFLFFFICFGLFIFQLFKWMFFTVSLYCYKKCFLSNIESYLFIMVIKYFQYCWTFFCYVIRHTSSKQNCNKHKFHLSKVRASLSILYTWIQ